MSMRPTMTNEAYFITLRHKHEEIVSVLETIRAGKLSEIEKFISDTLGPDVFDPSFNFTQLEHPMPEPSATLTVEDAVIARIRRAPEAYRESLKQALDIETETLAFMEACRERQTDESMEQACKQSATRLTLLTLLSKEQEVSTGIEHDPNQIPLAAPLKNILARAAINRQLNTQGQSYPRTESSRKLENASNKYLWAAHAAMDWAAIDIALEALRLTVKTTPTRASIDDTDHTAVILGVGRKLRQAKALMESASNACPVLSRQVTAHGHRKGPTYLN